MAKKMNIWFIALLLLAVAGAFISAIAAQPFFLILVAVVSLIVGFININHSEVTGFLIAITALTVTAVGLSAVLGALPVIGAFIITFGNAIVAAFAPAAFVVGIRHVIRVSSS